MNTDDLISEFLGIKNFGNCDSKSWVKSFDKSIIQIDNFNVGEPGISIRYKFNAKSCFEACIVNPKIWSTKAYYGVVTRNVLVIENLSISLSITDHDAYFEISVGEKDNNKPTPEQNSSISN